MAEAMIDMVVDQGLLGVDDRTLDCLQLLSDLDAGASFFDHRHDAAQVAASAVQSLYDRRVRLVLMISHAESTPGMKLAVSSPGGYCKPHSYPPGEDDS